MKYEVRLAPHLMKNAIRRLQQQFELARHGEAANVRPMEGLRGLAVFLVFLTHYVSLMSPWIQHGSLLDGIAHSIHTIGNTGVDIFFVLSGYLIYGSMISRPQKFLDFMRRRIARIYPVFTAVFILYLALSFLHPAESKIPAGAYAATVYIVQNFLLLPGMLPITPIIAVAWSLSYEMFYYLAIPVTIKLFGLRDRSPVFRTVFFLAAALVLVTYSVFSGQHIRLVMFIAGIMLFEIIRGGTLKAPQSWIASTALLIGLLASLFPASGATAIVAKVLIQACTFVVFCFSCFTHTRGWLARGFSWTPLRWLGNMSYSYYLIHGLALKAGYMVLFRHTQDVTHGAAFFVLMIPVMFTITLIPSAILFLTIERPFSLKAGPVGETIRGKSVVTRTI